MNFLDIHFLWHLLWVLPVMTFIYFYARSKRNKALAYIFGSRAASEDFVQLSRTRRFVRFLLLISAFIFLFIAAARPYWGYRILPFNGKGRDMMVVLDVSRSMLAKDVQPSRLEHAKWFIRQLLEKSHGDRFGLIAFAGAAFLECPLTSDKTSFFQVLNEMKTDSIPLGGTNIQAALEKSLDEFKAAETTNRAIILITDGDELHGNSSAVLQQLKDSRIPIFVVGIGDPAQPGLIPLPSEDGKSSTFLRDENGELVKSTLNEKQLSSLALATSGIYVRSTTANTGLTQILDRVKGLVPKEYDGGKHTRPIEKFIYPLIAGLILLLCWFFISERKSLNGKNLKKAFLLLLSMSSMQLGATDKNALPVPQDDSALLKPADVKLPQQDADKKEKQSIPNDPVLIYNIAREAQEKKDLPAAAALYENAINASLNMPSVRASSYQNLGVINHNNSRAAIEQSMAKVKQQDLDGALEGIGNAMKGFDKTEEMYIEAMNFQKSSEKTETAVSENQQKLLIDRENAEKLKKMIEDLKKQQQDAQDKTQQAKDQQNKENNKQNKDNKQQKDNKQNKDDKKKDDKDKKQDKQDKQQQDKQQQDKQQQDNQNKEQDKKDSQKEEDKQQKQEEQKQDKQEEQKQQEKSQEQKNYQNQSPENALKNAQQSVNDLKDKAEKLEQENIKKSAEEAKKELDKAADAQKKHDGKKAEDHIDKALKTLGAEENKDKKQDKDSQKDDKNNKDNKDKQDNKDKKPENKDDKDKQNNNQDNKDKQLPKAEKKDDKQNKQNKDEKEIDPAQAQAILDLMANQEKNLRDAIKERQKEAYGIKNVDKNW